MKPNDVIFQKSTAKSVNLHSNDRNPSPHKVTLHLFNPENDLALALGCRHYTPPPHAVAIHNAGALLPMWWAEKEDRVIAP